MLEFILLFWYAILGLITLFGSLVTLAGLVCSFNGDNDNSRALGSMMFFFGSMFLLADIFLIVLTAIARIYL